MKKNNLEVDLQISIIKEGKHYIAYVPSLDLSSCGKTIKEARRMIKEAIEIFLEECIKDRVLEDVLRDLGWVKARSNWSPPVIVSQELQSVKI